MFRQGKCVLVIGAHPDDIVLGAGATIAKLAGEMDFFCYTLSPNAIGDLPGNLPQENIDALMHLGVLRERIFLLDFQERHFPSQHQRICDALWKIKHDIQPDIVITHSGNDMHQDHATTFQETKRAFRDKTILAMGVQRSQDNFHPNLFVEVQRNHLDKKLAALAKYHTFRDKHYFKPEIVASLAVANGVQMEKDYMEGFEVHRIIS